MARQITLNNGLSNVLLPNMLRYNGGAVVILSDAEYSELSAAWKAANLSSDTSVGGGSSLGDPVTFAHGGTGQATQQAAMDALAGAQTSGQFLRGNGTHVAMAAIQAGDVPDLAYVDSVAAGDASITVGGTSDAPTVETGTLDQIATLHPAAANWSNNNHKITAVANGSGAQDAAAFGQLPSSGTPLALASGGTGVSAASDAALLDSLGALDASENLSDLGSATTAVSNLGLGLKPSGDTTGATDLTNINAVIAAGGPLYLTAGGTYYINGPMTALPSGFLFAGGRGAAGTTSVPAVITLVAAYSSATAPITFASGSADQEIRDVSFDATAVTAGTCDCINQTTGGPVTYVKLRDLLIIGGGFTSGIHATGTGGNPSGWVGERIRVRSTHGSGILLVSATDGTWTDVQAANCGTHGWSIQGCQGSRFTACRGNQNTNNGFSISGSGWGTGAGSGGATFVGCTTDRNTQSGVSISSTGTGPMVFAGCSFRRDGSDGNSTRAGLLVATGTTNPVIVSGLSVFPGVNDDGSGSAGPALGVSVTGATAVAIETSYIQGATTAISNGGSNTLLYVGPGVVQATGTTASPTITGTTLPIASGGTGTATGAPQNDVFAGPTSGTGAPSFRALVAADLPSGTTSAKGALQLDATATDIAINGTQAAGSTGKAADAGHVHPTDTSRAQDSLTVHLAGTETITGSKTFNVPPNLATQSVSGTATLAAASAPVVLTDTTTAAFTLTLPAAPATGEFFIVVDDTGQWNTHNLTIGRNSKNIDGAASNLTLVNQWGKVFLYYDGTAWWSLANGLSNEAPVATGAAAAGTHNSASRADHVHPTTGLVTSVAATDTSIVVGGTSAAPTIATGTLDVIATDHPPAAAVPMNGKTLTNSGVGGVTLPWFGGMFGDGSDSSVNFDGTSTVLGIVPSTGSYTLTRDIFATSIQVGGGATATTIVTNGWRIFCQGTVTVASNGTISAAGTSASGTNGSVAGVSTGQGSLGGGRPGGAGQVGGGSIGTGSTGVGTGAPGAGGNGTSNGGTSVGASSSTNTGWLRTPQCALATAIFTSSGTSRVDGAGGGSGGGGDGTNKGGGGGSGGGVVAIFAWAVSNAGTITAAGGNGGSPSTVVTNGGCGGGGAGAGGLVLIYTLSAVTGAGTVSVAAGNVGTGVHNGSGTGTNGGTGAAGNYLNVVVA